MVFWDSKMIAMKPEKMFWTAGIELYRWVMSNGPYGYKKNLKMVSMFLDFWAEISTRYCWRLIFLCFSFRGGSEKLNFALKNQFWSMIKILIKNIFSAFCFSNFCIFPHIRFLIFLTFANFVEKIIVWQWFFMVFVQFCSQNPPPSPFVIY